VLAGLAVAVFGGGATLSYYVDALWFGSLGYTSVFWTRLNLEAATFGASALITFIALYGAFLALKPAQLDELIGGTIFINRQRVKLPIEPVLNLTALGLALAISAAIGASMMAQWTTLALYWHAPRGATTLDPVFRATPELLPVYAAGLAAHSRLVADAGRDRPALSPPCSSPSRQPRVVLSGTALSGRDETVARVVDWLSLRCS